jgi:hypothetical protein
VAVDWDSRTERLPRCSFIDRSDPSRLTTRCIRVVHPEDPDRHILREVAPSEIVDTGEHPGPPTDPGLPAAFTDQYGPAVVLILPRVRAGGGLGAEQARVAYVVQLLTHALVGYDLGQPADLGELYEALDHIRTVLHIRETTGRPG